MNTLAIAALLTAGAATLYAIWRALRRKAQPNDAAGGIAVAVIMLILMGTLDARDKRIAAEEARQRAEAQQRGRITLNLDDHCPPRTDGLTDQAVMLITSQADHKPQVDTCLRIAQRPSQHTAKGTP